MSQLPDDNDRHGLAIIRGLVELARERRDGIPVKWAVAVAGTGAVAAYLWLGHAAINMPMPVASNVNDALQGTYGTPSNTNRYVTADDPSHSGTVTSVATTAPITGGTITTTGTIGLDLGSGGSLAVSASKLVRAALTGDAAATSDSNTITLATVNGSPGSFGSASKTITATVNGKGLATAMAETDIAIAGSQITSGTVAIAQGGTGAATFASGTVFGNNTSGAAAPAAQSTILLIGAAPQITLGKTSTATGRIDFVGTTSGTTTLTVPAAAGSVTVTLPAVATTFPTANPGSTLPLVGTSGGVQSYAALTTAQGGTGKTSNYVAGEFVFASTTTALAGTGVGAVGAFPLANNTGTPAFLADVAVGSLLVSGGANTNPAYLAIQTCTSSAATTCTITVARSGCNPLCGPGATASSSYLKSAVVSTTTLTCTFGATGTNTCWCVCP